MPDLSLVEWLDYLRAGGTVKDAPKEAVEELRVKLAALELLWDERFGGNDG